MKREFEKNFNPIQCGFVEIFVEPRAPRVRVQATVVSMNLKSVFIRKLIEARETKAQNAVREIHHNREREEKNSTNSAKSSHTRTSLNRSRAQHKTHKFKIHIFCHKITRTVGIYVPRRRFPIKMPSTGKFITCISFIIHTLLAFARKFQNKRFRRAKTAPAYGNLHFLRSFIWDFTRDARERERAAALPRCFFYFYLNAEYFIAGEN